MKENVIMDSFFLLNPLYRGITETVILVLTGVAGSLLSWRTLLVFPISNIAGGFLILLSLAFHGWVEKNHKQAHQESKEINNIITTGVYSKIRHPLYLSIIVMNIGIALAFGVIVTYIVALISIIHWTITSVKEEEFLIHQLPQYVQYKKDVRWRMIPGIF